MEKEGNLYDKYLGELNSTYEINLSLDEYDDIFSDFDPRPYSQRALSQDFLAEAHRASMEYISGPIKLNLLVPKKMRKDVHEGAVRKRLREHFMKHHDALQRERKTIIRDGIIFVVLGIFLMIAASIILLKFYDKESIFTHFLIVFLEPGGWFLFWEGLDLVIFTSKKEKAKLDFYEKMTRCEIAFSSC